MQNSQDEFVNLTDDELEAKAYRIIDLAKQLSLYHEDPLFRLRITELEDYAEYFSDAVAQEISDQLMCEVNQEV